MTIPPTSSRPVRAPEASEARGQERVPDRDADDGAAAAAQRKAPPSAGTGRLVDTFA